MRRHAAFAGRGGIWLLSLSLFVVVVLGGCRTGPQATRPPRLEADRLAPYDPARVKRVAVVPLRSFTPTDEPTLEIGEPFTATLIHTLRTRCGVEPIPGYLPDAVGFLTEARHWYGGRRKSTFPLSRFEALRDSVSADAYLVSWIDRSSREWLTNDTLERVPGGFYRLEVTFLLLDPSGKLLWSVVGNEEVRHDGSAALMVKTAVDKTMKRVERAFAGQENWQLGISSTAQE